MATSPFSVPFYQRECGKLFPMRIDKFLKVSRLIKRRELAKALCEAGDVKINGKAAKPSSEVKEGDAIEIHIGRHIIEARVKELRMSALKSQAESMYEITKDQIVGLA